MKTSSKVLLSVGVLALGATTMVGAGLAHGRGAYGHHGGPGWGGPRSERLFEMFDANGDGTITQAEIDEVRQNRLAEFDANGDGQLTLEEYQTLWMDAMRERMVDRFQALDDDGDAIVTVEEFVEPFDSMAERLDRNRDGQVTKDELRRPPYHRDRDRDDQDG